MADFGLVFLAWRAFALFVDPFRMLTSQDLTEITREVVLGLLTAFRFADEGGHSGSRVRVYDCDQAMPPKET